jgi:hypothetical protein
MTDILESEEVIQKFANSDKNELSDSDDNNDSDNDGGICVTGTNIFWEDTRNYSEQSQQ